VIEASAQPLTLLPTYPSSTHGDADGDRTALSTYHDHILGSHHLKTAGLLVFRLDILLESEAGAT